MKRGVKKDMERGIMKRELGEEIMEIHRSRDRKKH